MERLNSGDQRIIFGRFLCTLNIGLMKCGRVKWQEAEETRRISILYWCFGRILYLRALKVTQDAIPLILHYRTRYLFRTISRVHFYHIGCAINLHSITNSGLIPGGQNFSKRQTVFFTSVDLMNKKHRDPNKIYLEAPRLAWYKQKKWNKHTGIFFTAVNPVNKEHKDPYDIDFTAPRLAWYKQKTWKNTNTRCIGSTFRLLSRKDWSSIKHDRTQSSFTTHSQLIVSRNAIMMEKSRTRKYMRHVNFLSSFFFNDWIKELGSEVAGGSEDSQQTQPRSKTQSSSTERPVKSEQPSGSLTQEIDKGCLVWLRKHHCKNGQTC